ncbi:ABC transporter ATP-binding protein [Desmospora profundinema]|uniref:ABC-2 type transport system ATP-binding protein n=1 Tax=Desmospora profundinema TaxID=1571184 RepID=A0ABU1IPH0_9BACL|nr:ABC transporter ATP-binding protein [Desmospora profundinema]MDR6226685.1 ABC-2 type transport system ATP-binding protein [Desmospora profundinema]
MSEWTVETVHLTKTYQGHPAVDQLNLQVGQGSIFGLLGPNGAGKSTLIRMLMGSVLPTSGEARLFGSPVSEATAHLRQRVGYVPDQPIFYPFFQVEELLTLYAKTYEAWDEKRCRQWIDQFGIPLKKRTRSLSKGMKMQLALILALSIRPRLLILDEPTSGLDAVMKQQVYRLILDEVAAEGITVLLATHHLSELERIADHVAVMYKGNILWSRPLDELKAQSRKIQVVFPKGIPPEVEQWPELLHAEAHGSVHNLIVDGDIQQTMKKLKTFQPVYMESLPLTLEEIFIHHTEKEGYGHDFRQLV